MSMPAQYRGWLDHRCSIEVSHRRSVLVARLTTMVCDNLDRS